MGLEVYRLHNLLASGETDTFVRRTLVVVADLRQALHRTGISQTDHLMVLGKILSACHSSKM